MDLGKVRLYFADIGLVHLCANVFRILN